jgi:predicted amidophosphoribosyltransferase
VERGEFDRTKALAEELARLFGTRSEALLRLTASVSKRALRTHGRYSAFEFEQALSPILRASAKVRNRGSVLLVDDVCTDGSTLRSAAARLWEVNPDLEIVASTAALMVKAPVVVSARRLLR